MAEKSSEPPKVELTAIYKGPESTKVFAHQLPSNSTSSTEEKTNYLSVLRKSVIQLQGEVNEHLTAKMEEDKSVQTATTKGVDDRKEEENYGEEVEDEA